MQLRIILCNTTTEDIQYILIHMKYKYSIVYKHIFPFSKNSKSEHYLIMIKKKKQNVEAISVLVKTPLLASNMTTTNISIISYDS